jgi:hypothetical protein
MDVIDWLLEEEDASARYLTLRHVLGHPEDDPQVMAARGAIPGQPPARSILEAQWPAGYWMHPDIGYSPRHKATMWQVIFLSALGAPRPASIDRACAYMLEHSRLPDGRFTALASDRQAAASRSAHVDTTTQGTFLCLNGNLVRALFRLGYADPRRQESLEALAGMLLRAGPRCETCDRVADGDAGPRCVYGTIKALGALVQVPESGRSPRVQAATRAAITFLTRSEGEVLGRLTLLADTYGSETVPGPLGHDLGFPLDNRADLLEALEVLALAGAGPSSGVEAALAIIHHKQRADGRWPLDYVPGNTWANFGQVGQPNKWVTIRALQVLELWSSFYPYSPQSTNPISKGGTISFSNRS